MSRENVEIVRHALERFLAGELLLDTLDEDVEIHDHDIPESGDYRGHEGFLQWLTDWDQAWADWSLELEEVHDAGDRVVAVVGMSATGRASGARINRQDALLYEMRDGKAVRVDYFNNREQALGAAGLSETGDPIA